MLDKINQIKNMKVLIIGDIILDHYINVSSSKISEEAPILIFNYNSEYYSLGGGANVAKYLANFGCNVDILGIIGNDNNGIVIEKMFEDSGINTSLIVKENEIVTTTKTRFFSNDNKQIFRFDRENNANCFSNKIIKKIKQLNNDYNLIIVSDYNKGVITNKVFDELKKISKHTHIICDPKNNNLIYEDLFLLKPNIKEMNSLINNCTDKKIFEYKNNHNIKNILLTLGKDGMKLYDSNNEMHYISAHKNNVYDVTGAGDCVLSYLALGLMLNLNIIDSCKLSNYAASLKVGRFGTEIVPLYEVISFYDCKLISRENLTALCDILHKNKKIVFTNGCFDIIHSGHIHNLRNAKKEGDILIVGLNSDDSIRRIKGLTRPVLKVDERIEILKSLDFVDYIVVFDEDTPLNIINDIKPDVLVKGADYKNKLIVGQKEVELYGGKIVLLDLIDGKSTTNIINKIKRSNNE